MTDGSEITLEDDGVLFLRGYLELAEVEDQAVEIALLTVLRGLHEGDVLFGPFTPDGCASGGGSRRGVCGTGRGMWSFVCCLRR